MQHIDYLAIGHVAEDVWDDGMTPGGTVMYSSRAAHAFVPRVSVLTAAAKSFALGGAFPGLDVHNVDTPTTTQFENVYSHSAQADGTIRSMRTQVVRPCPIRLNRSHVTGQLAHARIAHLGPICNEIELDILGAFDAATLICMTPQGWLRRWDASGRVTQSAGHWTNARAFLNASAAVVMSIDDIDGEWDVANEWSKHARLLVVTQGPRGCVAYINGMPHTVPAPRVDEVEATGAGDIFAATFFVQFAQHADALRACTTANCIAAQSVTRPRLAGLPSAADIAKCL